MTRWSVNLEQNMINGSSLWTGITASILDEALGRRAKKQNFSQANNIRGAFKM
jgi:hypothetical protein